MCNSTERRLIRRMNMLSDACTGEMALSRDQHTTELLIFRLQSRLSPGMDTIGAQWSAGTAAFRRLSHVS